MFARQLGLTRVGPILQRNAARTIVGAPRPQKEPVSSVPTSPAEAKRVPKSPISRYILSTPERRERFLKFATFLGFNSSKQAALRRSIAFYDKLCVPSPEKDHAFWQDECHMPPTFQSWFLVTNLHVWLLTARLRALPKPHGKEHIQALLDTFFGDVEDRIRAVLQPGPAPKAYSYPSSPFYVNPNFGANTPTGQKVRKAPERLVTQQMKIFREQWAGMGLAMDLGLVRGDADMAGAIWRNLLGARGARGIMYHAPEGDKPYFRRTVNLAGGEVINYKNILKKGLEKEEQTDDLSGVHDYAPSEADKYVKYPELMETINVYIRRELARLGEISDEELLGPRQYTLDRIGVSEMAFGAMRLPSESLPVDTKPAAANTPSRATKKPKPKRK